MVLGEGQTEQFYLKHLKALKDYTYTIKPSLFTRITVELAEEKIDELLSGGCDRIVFLTDYDVIVSQQKQERFTALIDKYSSRPEVFICESMPSIEFWFLLHYCTTTREFQNSDQVSVELKRYLRDYSKGRNFLENERWVRDIVSSGKMEQAIANSRTILRLKETARVGSHFPFTKMHLSIGIFEEMKNSGM